MFSKSIQYQYLFLFIIINNLFKITYCEIINELMSKWLEEVIPKRLYY
jgi:hypothetical protein